MRTKNQNGLSGKEAEKYYEENISEKYDKLNEALFFLDKVGNLLWDLESQVKKFKEDSVLFFLLPASFLKKILSEKLFA